MKNRKNLKIGYMIILFTLSTSIMLADNLDKKRPLNVLICSKSFPCFTSWFVLNITTYLIKHGHNVVILSRDPSQTSVNDQHPDIVKYKLLEKTYVNYLPPDKRKFDVILCQFSSLAPYIIDFKKMHNVQGKLAVFVRGAFCYRKARHKEVRDKIFAETDLFIPVCDYSKKKLMQLRCPKKIEVIHSTIDCNKFAYEKRPMPKNGEINIVTTSRLSSQKGLEYAISAIARVVKNHPKVSYNIIGDGPLGGSLQKLIDSLKLGDSIKLLGWKTPDQVSKILSQSHIFLHPSVMTVSGGHEAIPTAIMEALARGLPVISTYHAGIPELIKNGKSGFLVRERDVSGLAQRINYLIAHPEIWNALGLTGRRQIEKDFNREKENQKLLALCLKLAGRN